MAITFLTNEDRAELEQQIEDVKQSSGGNADQSGLTTAQIDALHGMFKVCAYDDSKDVSGAYAAFKTAFGITDSGEEEPDEPVVPDEPEVTLSSISATYNGGDAAVGTAVTDLTGIVVTAHYSDGTSEAVTGYTLSGTIAEGSNTVTVSYGGKTTTFIVTGVVESGGEVENAVYKYSLADGTMLLHLGGLGYAYNTACYQTPSTSRRAPYLTEGEAPARMQSDAEDTTHFIFPIPDDATGIIVTAPSGNVLAPMFFTLNDNGLYTRDVDVGWTDSNVWSTTFEAGLYSHFGTSVKLASGGLYSTSTEITEFTIEFTK